ncbi:unnamed protein product [Phaeothamnion confervicola]
MASLAVLACLCVSAQAQTGRELVEESLRRQAPPPSVYEERVLLLIDSLGQHTVRTARYYSRLDSAGLRRLMVIDTPRELRGIRLYVSRDAGGGARNGPAASSPVFGSDYTVADFEGEQPQDFNYEREDNQELDRVTHLVVRATPRDEAVARATGYGVRRIYLRKDNLFVSRIDCLDRQGRIAKRLTFKDPRPDDTGAWRPGMTLTEDLREDRRTLLKVERRVHSADYVPAGVFEAPQ